MGVELTGAGPSGTELMGTESLEGELSGEGPFGAGPAGSGCLEGELSGTQSSGAGPEEAGSAGKEMSDAKSADAVTAGRESADVKPVSYTHLDVYKRQIQERIRKGAMGSADWTVLIFRGTTL